MFAFYRMNTYTVALWVYEQRNTKCPFGRLYLIDLHFTLCTYLLYVTRNERYSTLSHVCKVSIYMSTLLRHNIVKISESSPFPAVVRELLLLTHTSW